MTQVGKVNLGWLQAVVPELNDEAVVVNGTALAGQVGRVISINRDSQQCALNIGGEVKVLPMSVLCKFDKSTA